MSVYESKPTTFFKLIHPKEASVADDDIFCAGFEFSEWRCEGLAEHLVEWLPDYALSDDLLGTMNHANAYAKLREAAHRVYSSDKFEKRGEVGELVAHAICREFFDTIPISPRVYYKSTSNEVIKGFDLVHARTTEKGAELWLGEAKTYQDRTSSIVAAIKSIKEHLERGFLKSQRILLGPTVPKNTNNRDAIVRLFDPNLPIDEMVDRTVFPIISVSESDAVLASKSSDDSYKKAVVSELEELSAIVEESELSSKISVFLIYVPVKSKVELVTAFDSRLKGLQ